MKKILNSEISKQIALETIIEVAGIVKQTLGPGGNSIILQQAGTNPDGTPRTPLITKDGVTVAESISYRDPSKNTIAQAIITTAQNTVRSAGDGTTSAIVLAEAIYKEGYKYLKQGMNGIQLYNDLRRIKDQILEKLDELKTEVKLEDVINVAKVSANGDEEIAQIVAEAILAVGEDGHVALEEGCSRETTLIKIEGAVYKQGWRGFGPHGSLLITDKSQNVCELEKPAVLLYAGKLQEIHEISDVIIKIMDGDHNTGQLKNIIPLFIIAYDYSDEVKNFIIQNRVQVKIPIAAIKAPFDGSPNARTAMLEDLSVLLGGHVMARGIRDLEDITDEDLGCADKIVIKDEETIIFGGHGEADKIIERVEELKKLEQSQLHEFDKENTRIRIGKLTGGIAVIRSGGDSELEIREKKDRIEDALCAAKAAIIDGTVEGGGLTLYQISQLLEKEESIAYKIMREALKAPIKQIIANVGENAEVILSHMPQGQGYDARRKTFCNMTEAGIIDPVKVTKSALENAVSIAGLLLTTGGAVVNDTGTKDGLPNPLSMLGGMSE